MKSLESFSELSNRYFCAGAEDNVWTLLRLYYTLLKISDSIFQSA